MASINVSEFNCKSSSAHNDALNRQVFVPALDSEYFQIRTGPSPKVIASAPTESIDSDLTSLCGLYVRWDPKNREMSRLVLDRVPITFRLIDDTKLAVFVASVDFEPAREPYPEDFFTDGTGHGLSDSTMLIHGWYVSLPSRHTSKKRVLLAEAMLNRCVIAYSPSGEYGNMSKGYIARVADEQPLPRTQVIKDIDALQYLLDAHYKGGYMESVGPTGTRWGRLHGGLGMVGWQWVELSALRGVNGEWKFKFPRRDEVMSMSLVGISFSRTSVERVELKGDTILCSDGTILHTYYFSRAEVIAEGATRVPDDWRDGYYYNRFYPPNSPLVPKEVIESYNRDMPDWFKTNLLLANEKV